MKKSLAVLIGVAAGVALTAAIASTRKGKEIRSDLTKRADEIRQNLAKNVIDRSESIQETDFIYI